MSTSVYVRTKEYRPSNYYRIVQYTPYLKSTKLHSLLPSSLYKAGIRYRETPLIKIFVRIIIYIWIAGSLTFYLVKDNLKVPSSIIVQKELMPIYMPLYISFLLRRLARKSQLIWDFDDNIFEQRQASRKELNILIKYSKFIITTNDYLKSKIDKKYQYKVILMPTTDKDMLVPNLSKQNNKRLITYKNGIHLIWIGTSFNLHNLISVISYLDKAAYTLKISLKKSLILTVICDTPLKTRTKHLIIKNIKWSRKNAKIEVLNAHIGIMPLLNNKYNKGKASFKLIQYLSAGLPVIGSNVGFNSKVINNKNGVLVNNKETEWINAILLLSQSDDIWQTYSKNAFASWEKNFNFQKNLETWKEILNLEKTFEKE